jgi:HlyD family secretion protein
MSPGKEVATIIPENGESFKIQMYVPNKDISNIDVGDQVKYRFDALPYKEYGVLEGKIKSISVDASYNEAQGTSYYLVESTVVNKPMVSYKGTQATIKVGMSLEAQVITESKSILHYLLEKIDLWD